jgi:OOP family OmpA-OmpF porin
MKFIRMPLQSLALVASAGFMATLAQAASFTPNAYVGGDVAYGRASGVSSKVDGALASQGITANSQGDSSSTNPGLKLGYQFDKNWAVELSYDRLGKMSVNSGVSAPAADTATGDWKAHGYGIHAVGSLPLDSKWSVTGRVGLENWHTRLNLASTTGGATHVSQSSTNNALVLGVGASYAVSKNLDATGELVHYNRVGDAATTGRDGVNTLSVGVRYHFL